MYTESDNNSNKTFLSFFRQYESLIVSQKINIDHLNKILKIKRQKNPTLIQQLKRQRQGKIEKNQSSKIQLNQRSNGRQFLSQQNEQNKNKIKAQDQRIQNNCTFQQNTRKSRRLQKRKQFSLQKNVNYKSMIKSVEKQRKSEQIKQFSRPMIQRLKNPGKPTLRQTQITYKNNQFYYSINLKFNEQCSKHKVDKKAHLSVPKFQQGFIKQQTGECICCKKAGTYWFSTEQLLKYNNGNYIRKYLQTFI